MPLGVAFFLFEKVFLMTEPVKTVNWVEPPWTVDVIGGDVCILGTPSENDADPREA